MYIVILDRCQYWCVSVILHLIFCWLVGFLWLMMIRPLSFHQAVPIFLVFSPLPWYPNIGPCQRSISEPTEFTIHSHFNFLCLKLCQTQNSKLWEITPTSFVFKWENSGSTSQLDKSQIFKPQNVGLEILTFWNICFPNSSSSRTKQEPKWISLGDILMWGGGSSSPGR